MIVRSALPGDAPAVAALCAQLGYPEAETSVAARLEHLLGSPDNAIFTAVLDDRTPQVVIGWVHVLRVCYLEADPFAEIGGLVVDSAFRRLGAGRALMAAAEAWAAQHGLFTVRLRSNIIRTEAHQFYQRTGYHIAKSQYTFSKDLAAG